VSNEKILLVDDEPAVLDVCERILASDGYQITTASSGHEAIKLARRERFDLVLTDMKMPGTSGLDTFHEIQALDPEITGVVVTGYGTMQMAIEALRLGFDGFVTKPFAPEDLRLAVSEALSKRRLRMENARLNALIPLYEVSRAFITTIDLDALLQQVVNTSSRATGADRCSLMLLQPETDELVVRAAVGLPPNVIGTARERVGHGIAGYVAQTHETLLLNDPNHVPPRVRDAMVHGEVLSALSVPMIVRTELVGVLNLSKLQSTPPFSEGDRDLVNILASQAAIAIENATLFSEIQRAYQELKELDRLKSEFINIASHELRTPLAVVRAYAELLETETDNTGREFLTILQQSVDQMGAIVNDIVNLENLERGEATLQMTWIDLAELIREVSERFAPLTHAKQQELAVNLTPNLPVIPGDWRKLDLVIANLLSNAVKFTSPQGRIEIRAWPETEQVVVAVEDTGIGIPVEAQQRVFDRFYQVQESLTRDHGGLGLGLSIVKGMVELHGGRVWLKSTPGVGSTFFISLPRQSEGLEVGG
jgi:signal transduction histidine kinase/ActR/RegA family two-component response regulator